MKQTQVLWQEFRKGHLLEAKVTKAGQNLTLTQSRGLFLKTGDLAQIRSPDRATQMTGIQYKTTRRPKCHPLALQSWGRISTLLCLNFSIYQVEANVLPRRQGQADTLADTVG
jgi:hypothetical protein